MFFAQITIYYKTYLLRSFSIGLEKLDQIVTVQCPMTNQWLHKLVTIVTTLYSKPLP